MTTLTKQKKRLRRDDWLARAMDVLSRRGAAQLNIESLCEALERATSE